MSDRIDTHVMPGVFAAYRNITPRLWPRPALWRTPQEITVRPDLFLRTLLDGLPFVFAWPLFDGIEALQQSDLLPILVRWP